MQGMSLQTKFLLGTVGLVVLLGLAVIFAVQTILSQKLKAEVQKRGLSIARDIGRQSVDPILTENTVDLRLLVADFKSREKDIAYIFILNPQGEVLAHTFEAGFPLDLKEVNRVRSGETYRIQPLVTERGPILDIAVAVLNSGAGIAHVGISAESVEKGVADIIHLIIGIIIAVSAMGSGAAIYLAIKFTEPIVELAEVAKEVGGGGLKRKVHVRTKDEIGKLATAFNRMIEDLHRTTLSFRSVVQSSHDAIILADSDGNIILWNKGAQTIFGYEEKEVLGKPLALLMPERYRAAHQKEMERSRSAGDYRLVGSRAELHGLRKDGSQFPLEISLATWKTEDQTFFGGIIRDTTERKQAEKIQREFSRCSLRLQEEERRAIARELHDGVNQILSAARFHLSTVERAETPPRGKYLKEIENIRALLDEAIQEIRRISRRLRPSVLDDLGLVPAVRSFCTKFSKRTSIDVVLDCSRFSQPLSLDLETTLYRIIQEALHNVEEHAQTADVEIRLWQKDAFVFAEITDSGRGFDVVSTLRTSRGTGVCNMRERAAMMGGSLTLDSALDQGTKISIEIPLHLEEDCTNG